MPSIQVERRACPRHHPIGSSLRGRPPKEHFMSVGRILAVSFLSFAAVPLLAHAGPNGSVSLANDIQPIFDKNCISCHDDTSFLPLTAAISWANLVDQPTTPTSFKTAPC